MALRKEALYELIDKLPKEKYHDVFKYLKELHDTFEYDIETPSEQDRKDIEAARKEREKGEYYTFEEVFGDDD